MKKIAILCIVGIFLLAVGMASASVSPLQLRVIKNWGRIVKDGASIENRDIKDGESQDRMDFGSPLMIGLGLVFIGFSAYRVKLRNQ